MLKNYFRIAFRSLWRHKGFSALNIVGLAVGMAAFFLIFQYVRFEYSYDDFVPKRDRVYRLVTDLKSSAETSHGSGTAMAMAINLKREYPEVEDAVRLLGQTTFFKRGDVQFAEKATVYADSGLFKIFGYPLLEGDPATALIAPFSVVLSQSTAKKYFGDTDPMGKTILLSDSAYSAKVTGVMKDLPENSSIKADIFVSMTTATRKPVGDSLDYRWEWFNVTSYLLLKPGAAPAALQAQLKPFIDRHLGSKLKAEQQDYVLYIEKLKDSYWSGRGGWVSGNRSNVYISSRSLDCLFY